MVVMPVCLFLFVCFCAFLSWSEITAEPQYLGKTHFHMLRDVAVSCRVFSFGSCCG